jgi:hypothetical protein
MKDMAMMKSRTFDGKDDRDLEEQLWQWRSTNPNVVVKYKHPIERLPLEFRERKPGAKYRRQTWFRCGLITRIENQEERLWLGL